MVVCCFVRKPAPEQNYPDQITEDDYEIESSHAVLSAKRQLRFAQIVALMQIHGFQRAKGAQCNSLGRRPG